MVDGKATIIIVFFWICAAAAADIQERDLAALCPTTIGNMIYSSLLPASCVERKTEKILHFHFFVEGASHGWVVYNLLLDFRRCKLPIKSKEGFCFIYSRISVFSLRDYVGNARNAGMLLRLSLPANKRIPNTLFSLTYDSGL